MCAIVFHQLHCLRGRVLHYVMLDSSPQLGYNILATIEDTIVVRRRYRGSVADQGTGNGFGDICVGIVPGYRGMIGAVSDDSFLFVSYSWIAAPVLQCVGARRERQPRQRRFLGYVACLTRFLKQQAGPQ